MGELTRERRGLFGLDGRDAVSFEDVVTHSCRDRRPMGVGDAAASGFPGAPGPKLCAVLSAEQLRSGKMLMTMVVVVATLGRMTPTRMRGVDADAYAGRPSSSSTRGGHFLRSPKKSSIENRRLRKMLSNESSNECDIKHTEKAVSCKTDVVGEIGQPAAV